VVIVVDGIEEADELETRLAEHIRAVAEAGAPDDLSLAVLALDAVDHCFRESGLWPGNIYLAGTGTLAAVLHLAQGLELVHRRPGAVLRELASVPGCGQVPLRRIRRPGPVPAQRLGQSPGRPADGRARGRGPIECSPTEDRPASRH
jgi:hypothetical protein